MNPAALKLVINEAVDGRNYYSAENYTDPEAIAALAAALAALGCQVHVDDGELVRVTRYPTTKGLTHV